MVMCNVTEPARLVPPGRVIARELEARGWRREDLAAMMGQSEQAIRAMIDGDEPITPDMAYELAGAFGTSVDLWVDLEKRYRLRLAQNR